jgi:hypothetical protein
MSWAMEQKIARNDEKERSIRLQEEARDLPSSSPS